MSAHFKVYWRRPRRALTLPELNQYPESPSPQSDGHYPAFVLLTSNRINFKRQLQTLEHDVWPQPTPQSGYGKIGPRVPGHFVVKWRKQRDTIPAPNLASFPASPPPAAADDLVSAWLGHFEKTRQTKRRLQEVITPPDFPATPGIPEQPFTAYLPPEVFRRHSKRHIVYDPLLSYYEELSATYEYISWRLLGRGNIPIQGASPTVIIRRVSDRLYYDWDAGGFVGPVPATLKGSMVESDATNIAGVYEINLNIIDFDGRYQLFLQDETNNLYAEAEIIVVDGVIWADNTTNDLEDLRIADYNKRVHDKSAKTITLYKDDKTTTHKVFDVNADLSEIDPQ